MNNLKSKLLKALMRVSLGALGDCLHQPYRFSLIENGEDIVREAKELGALGAFVVTFVVYFWNLDMKLTSVMEGIMLKHYDKIDRDQHL